LKNILAQYKESCKVCFLEQVYNVNMFVRNVGYKKLLEYLFWMWDPSLPGGANEPERILEEGFMEAETYTVRSA